MTFSERDPAPASRFPVQNWERYEFIELIGEGSMGRVYKAYDPRLKRFVALKFIRGDDPELTKRFQQEAEAQARIEQDHVCKIYEVGEVQSKPYICMQFIDGCSLKDAGSQMNLQQKIRVIQQALRALEEAHRLGLIHRDMKPSNIMVEKRQEEWRASVVDFGLVRQMEGPAYTMTGEVLGTPAYMSPEQAAGGSRKADARTDIYGIGATLYESISGHRPFEGATGIETLMKVLQEEPVPLRRRDPAIPRDLESIVMKCLEKAPYRRYESAGKLSEDLDRYLEGQPVLARPAGISYRIQKKISKNPVLAATLVISVIIILLLAGVALYSFWRSAEKARLAQEFGQQVEKMESIMRIAYMLPLHDVRKEMQTVRNRMQEVRSQMKQVGKHAEGPGDYALARGYLALKEFQKAKLHLDRAWNNEYRPAEVALALGWVHGELFQQENLEAEQISNREIRILKKQQIEKEYRDPALKYLRLGRTSTTENAAFIRALVQYYEKQWEKASQSASSAYANAAWLYEAIVLEGNVHLAVAAEKRMSGDQTAAKEQLDQARKKFQAASRIAPSDPRIHESLCAWGGHVIAIENEVGGRAEDIYNASKKDCDNAQLANPDSAEAYANLSFLYSNQAESLALAGQDSTALYQQALSSGQRALQLRPDWILPHLHLGYAWMGFAEARISTGSDPTTDFQTAIRHYRSALQQNPNEAVAHNSIGYANSRLGLYALNSGADPQPFLRDSIKSFENAASLVPKEARFPSNIGAAYAMLGSYKMDHGHEPVQDLQNALKFFDRALTMNSNLASIRLNKGFIHMDLGKYESRHGRTPLPEMEKALENFDIAAKATPNFFYIPHARSIVYLQLAEFAALTGEDPTPHASRVIGNVEAGLKLNPAFAEFHESAGYALILEAQHAKQPGPLFDKARARLMRSLEIDPSAYTSYLRLGELEIANEAWANAEANLKKSLEMNSNNLRTYIALARCYVNRFWPGDFEQGIAILEKAAKLNPVHAETVALRGALLMQQAKIEMDPRKKASLMTEALALTEKAIQANQNLRFRYQTSSD
ncbi:protein kinase [bacterium]|nr:protein kinase [bacterium]